ncbi:prepilin peptidase [Campylobacter sp. 19-13652]|uniref:A24 family peptidase n=1 Tax=Campylobacter sp. 19-13652 TaxID=2840180 RepID=UPI001C854746
MAEQINNIVLILCAINFIRIIYTDIKYRQISNISNLTALGLIILCSYIFDFSLNITAAIIILFAGIILFYLGFIGGADVKLAVALSLAITQSELFLWLFYTSIVGALQALYTVFLAKITKNQSQIQKGVAYGVAIIFGFLMIIITRII